MKGIGHFQNLRNFWKLFRRIFMEEFWEKFFGRIFVWEDFFRRIFLGGFFERNSLGGIT